MLFYGPSGAGKKTRIAGTLLELFGKGVEKVRLKPPDNSFGSQYEIYPAATGLRSSRLTSASSSRPQNASWMSTLSRATSTSRLPRGERSVRSPCGLWFHSHALVSEVGNYDRVVIQEILKEIAQTQQVDLSAKQRFKRASPIRSPSVHMCTPLGHMY